MVEGYFSSINEIIVSFDTIIKHYTKTEKIYSTNKAFISGEIIFIDNKVLSFMEFQDENIKKKYSYHFMDEEKRLIFRYDNAEYHPEITTHPHHKHLPNSIVAATEPKLIDVLLEIYKNIQ